MTYIRLLTLITIASLFSCKSNTDSTTNSFHKIEKTKSQSINEKINSSEGQKLKSPKSEIDFKIIGDLKKIIDESNEIVKSDCNNWKLNPEIINKVFLTMKQVNSNEWNSYCYHYPCSYKGKANYNGKKYDIYINSASYVILIDKKSNEKIYFILEKKNRIFLKACNCCED